MKVCTCFLLFTIFADASSRFINYKTGDNNLTRSEEDNKEKPHHNVKRVSTFTKFILEAIDILNTYDDAAFQDFFNILDEELRKYHYRGCKFYEITENLETRRLLAAKLDQIKGRPAPVMRATINSFADALNHERYNANVKELVDYMNSLYRHDAEAKFHKVLNDLQYYSKSKRNVKYLTKMITHDIRLIFFDHYTNLITNARIGLRDRIQSLHNPSLNETKKPTSKEISEPIHLVMAGESDKETDSVHMDETFDESLTYSEEETSTAQTATQRQSLHRIEVTVRPIQKINGKEHLRRRTIIKPGLKMKNKHDTKYKPLKDVKSKPKLKTNQEFWSITEEEKYNKYEENSDNSDSKYISLDISNISENKFKNIQKYTEKKSKAQDFVEMFSKRSIDINTVSTKTRYKEQKKDFNRKNIQSTVKSRLKSAKPIIRDLTSFIIPQRRRQAQSSREHLTTSASTATPVGRSKWYEYYYDKQNGRRTTPSRCSHRKHNDIINKSTTKDLRRSDIVDNYVAKKIQTLEWELGELKKLNELKDRANNYNPKHSRRQTKKENILKTANANNTKIITVNATKKVPRPISSHTEAIITTKLDITLKNPSEKATDKITVDLQQIKNTTDDIKSNMQNSERNHFKDNVNKTNYLTTHADLKDKVPVHTVTLASAMAKINTNEVATTVLTGTGETMGCPGLRVSRTSEFEPNHPNTNNYTSSPANEFNSTTTLNFTRNCLNQISR